MKCLYNTCTKEAVTDNGHCLACEEYYARCIEWGKLHTAGKATFEDYPGYVPITVDINDINPNDLNR